jgi:hypothetical protein
MIATSIFLCESAVAVRSLVLGLIVFEPAWVESSGGRIFIGIITDPLLCLVEQRKFTSLLKRLYICDMCIMIIYVLNGRLTYF